MPRGGGQGTHKDGVLLASCSPVLLLLLPSTPLAPPPSAAVESQLRNRRAGVGQLRALAGCNLWYCNKTLSFFFRSFCIWTHEVVPVKFRFNEAKVFPTGRRGSLVLRRSQGLLACWPLDTFRWSYHWLNEDMAYYEFTEAFASIGETFFQTRASCLVVQLHTMRWGSAVGWIIVTRARRTL